MLTRVKGMGAAVVALVLALAVVVAPRVALADDYENVLYATLSDDGTTMTYSYGNASTDEHFVYMERNGGGFAFMGDGFDFDHDAVTKVIFDESVSDWHPTGSCFKYLFSIQSDEYGNTNRFGESVTSMDGVERFNTSDVTDVSGLFAGLASIESIDLSSLDFSSVVDASTLFSGCDALKSFVLPDDMSKCTSIWGLFEFSGIEDVDLSGVTFAPIVQDDVGFGVSQMFMGCPNIRSVNLSSISFADPNSEYAILFGDTTLPKSITVGRGWHFYDRVDEYFGTNIPQPPVNDTFTGKWWKGVGTQAYTPAEMGTLTDPDDIAGTWTWERRRYEVSFDLGYETDEQAPETVYVDLDGSIAELPTVSRDGYLFTGWADSNGYVYSPYKPTDDVCLVAQWSEVKPDPKPVAVEKVYMHRLYNPNSGEHFYTASTFERDHLVSVGWNYEGYAWGCPRISRTPVYRLYNPVSGDNHHYTVSAHERDVLVKAGWTDEGIAWYGVDDSCKDGTEVNVLRAYNPYTVTHKGTHNWTTSAYEQKVICDLGWRDEGVSFVAFPPKS